MYCLWARAVMESARDPWAEAETRLRSVASGRLFPPDELDLVLDPANAATYAANAATARPVTT